MTVLNPGQVADVLGRKGFRVATTGQVTQAVQVFQDAWRLGPLLTIDGKVGPLTTAALLESDRRYRAGRTDCSDHFSFGEFACPCRRSHRTCRGIVVAGALVDGLEALRGAAYADGLHLVDVYRCPEHNAGTDGSSGGSMHLYGAAADVAPRVKPAALDRLRAFSGRGWNTSSGKVSHVDVRGMGRNAAVRPPNPTGSTVVRPAGWTYAR